MAALNFPPSPSTNQIYTANSKSWRFDGTSWKTFYVLGVQGGGTGNTSYSLGDILVGAGTSILTLPVGANNYVLTVDTSTPSLLSWQSASGISITNINGIASSRQYFTVGASGTGFNISSSGSTHTFNIPIAGVGATGLVSTLAQTFAGEKTFTSAIIGDLTGTATTAGFASTAFYAYQAGYGITAGFATSASYSDQSGYGITAGFATTASYSYQSGYGITAGFATSASYAIESGYGITAGFATTASYSYQSGYGITSGFATTASYAYESGYGITSGFATTASYSLQSGYGITAGFATTASYADQSGYGITSGFATTAANINVVNATSNLAHPLIFGSTATGSGVAVSSNTTISFNPSTFILSTSGLAITAPTVSTSSSTGALVVSGGVGIGGSLFITSSLPSSLSGVVVNNGVIISGSWSGSTITAFYGGTGYNSYTKGDILVGAGNTFIKLNVGTDNYVLTASSLSSTGLTWSPTAATGLTTLNGLSVGIQFLAFGYSGTVPAFASSGSTHTLNIPLAGTGSTGLVSTQAQSFAGIKTFTNAVSITDNTGSGSYTSGALTVTGGVGIGGTLNVQGDLNVQGTFTTINSTTITVADKNIELGVVAVPSDLTAEGGGITLRGATNKSINWYSGVGWSSSESWNLASGNTFKINGTTVLSNNTLGTGVIFSSIQTAGIITSGTWSATAITALYGGTGLVPTFTVGDILYANTSTTWGRLSASSNSGYLLASSGSGSTPTYLDPLTLSVGYATTASYAYQSGYAITSGLATTANYAHQSGYAITSGFATTANYAYQSGYGLTSGFATTANYAYQSGYGLTSGLATTATYAHQSGYAITSGSSNTSGYATTSGFATTAANLNVSNASTGIFYPVLSNTASTTSGIGASVNSFFSFNAATGAFGTTSVNILSGQSYSVGGNSVLSATSLGTGVTNSSLTALGTITTGVWAGSLITGFYGGTGYNSYTKGDILVGAGSTFIRLNVGSDNFVLTASSTSSTGLTWSPTAATGITTLNSLTATQQFFSTGTSGTGFNISSSGSTHTFNIPIAGVGATGLVSTLAQSFAGVKTFTNDVIISSTTGSTAFNTGALTVYGGLGVSGQLSFNQAALGYTGATNPSMAFIGSTTDAPITLTVLSDNSLLWEGTSGKLFGINNNLSSGWIFNVGDISGLPIIRANADGTIAMAEFTANVGIGLSNPSYKLHVVGDTNLSSGYVYRINGTSVLSASSLGTGVTNSSLTAVGTLTTGVWAATAITAFYGGTGYNSYTKGDILVGAGNTFIKLNVGTDNFVLTANSSSATGLTWSPTAATGLTTLNGLSVGIQFLAFGYSGTVPAFASSGSTHTLNIPLAGSGSTGLISTQAQTIAGQKTFTSAIIGDLTGTATTAGFASTANYAHQSGYAITSGLATTATLALTISSNTTILNADYNIPFFSGTALSTNNNLYYNPSNGRLNALIYTGSWAGNTITSFYGGTGYSTYSTGDLLVGAGSTLYKLATGTNNFVLVADSAVPGGIKWANVSGFAITNINGLTASKQDLAFGYSGTVPAFSSSGSTHTLNIPLAGTGSTGLVSTQAQSFAGIKTFTNAVSITDNTGSGSYTTGALTVTGGVGIGGTLNVQGDLNVQGTFTTINSTTITVADKNIELGVVASPSDLTAQGGGITLRGATDKSINWYSGVGWSSSESFNLASGNTYKINNTTVLSNSSLGTGVTNSSLTALGTITTGVWAATAITAFYGGTGYNSYTKGDILVGAGNTFIKLGVGTDNYVLTALSTSSTGLTWSPTAATGLTTLNGLNIGIQYFATGTSGSGFNISSSGSTHTFNIPIAGVGATGLVSTLAQTFTGAKTFDTTLTVSATTPSTNFSSGALIVAGGAGFAGTIYTQTDLNVGNSTTGRLFFSQATLGSAGTTVIPSMAFIGATNSPITLSVLADNSLSFDGSSGQLFSINNNLSSGWIFAVNDISGLPLLRANADGTVAMGEFAGNVGVGLSNPSYKLHVVGDTNLSSGYVYRINGTSVLSATSLGTGVTNSSLTAVGTITTGTWSATAITAFYGGTGYQSYTVGDLLVGAGSTLYKLSVGTNNFVLTADSTAPGGVKWSTAASTGVTTVNSLTSSIQYFATGTSGSEFNISSSGSTHTFNIPIASTGSTGLVSTLAQSFAGIKTFTNDLVISSSTLSTSTSTGALTVTGGVGIGGSLFTGTSTADSISGVVLNNGVITTGSWSATAITARYGGTGNTSYTLGDLLVGAGSTFIKLPVGINSYVLGADSSRLSGVGWTSVTPLTISDTPPASPKNADLWFNSVDGGLLVYYSDVDTNQWVEIALGSGIDLTQPVHITNTTASTSTTTGALIVDGGAGFASTIYAPVISINGIYDQISSTLTTSSTTVDQVAMSLGSTVYRTLKLNVQMTSSTSYHSQEILMVHDGTLVYMTEYAIVNNGSILSTFDADISGGNIRLLVSPTNAVTTYKIACSAIRI